MSLSLSSYKGTRDLYPEDMRLRRYIFDTWARVAERFGYEKYDAPILEPLEIYAAKSGEEIVNDQTYTFSDRGERKVAIRPEMTPSVARMVAARRQEMPLPARLYSIANFMRYERPQKGREREFWQLNVDIFGVAGINADIEVITMADTILHEFGATDEMFTIRINDRRLTDWLMREYLGLNSDTAANQMIKLFDRRAKMSPAEFEQQARDILNENVPINVLETLTKIQKITEVKDLDEFAANVPINVPINDLKTLMKTLKERGVASAQFDPTLMRGFDYYTGIVFEVFDRNPDNNRAMFGGGRYDGLVGLFGVEDMPVVGFAPGETTTVEFLRAWDLLPELEPATEIVLIPLGEVDVQLATDQLRAAGLNVAVDYTERKVEKKIKSAVKQDVPYLLFVGDEELASGKFTLKNVATQDERKLTTGEIVSRLR
jgi:histidyl-tRNA synthetase